MQESTIHPTAEVSPTAKIGKNTKIWHLSQVREDVQIGDDCVLGKNVYIDFGVSVGNKVKIQNNSSVFHGSKIEDGVFIGPHVCFCNDKTPRAVNPDFSQKGENDWQVSGVTIKKGASVGACSVLLPGVTVGEFAMIGAGSVVTKDVPEYAMVFGNPAKIVGSVCKCGSKLDANNFCKNCNK